MSGTQFFICAMCGGLFSKARSNSEALLDCWHLWGYHDAAALVEVCQDCFDSRTLAELEEFTGLPAKGEKQ
jgi:hypothetical protein